MTCEKGLEDWNSWKESRTSEPYQDVQTCRFEESDLVSDGECSEAREPLGKLHNLYNALSGELTELIPQAQVQLYSVVST